MLKNTTFIYLITLVTNRVIFRKDQFTGCTDTSQRVFNQNVFLFNILQIEFSVPCHNFDLCLNNIYNTKECCIDIICREMNKVCRNYTNSDSIRKWYCYKIVERNKQILMKISDDNFAGGTNANPTYKEELFIDKYNRLFNLSTDQAGYCIGPDTKLKDPTNNCPGELLDIQTSNFDNSLFFFKFSGTNNCLSLNKSVLTEAVIVDCNVDDPYQAFREDGGNYYIIPDGTTTGTKYFLAYKFLYNPNDTVFFELISGTNQKIWKLV